MVIIFAVNAYLVVGALVAMATQIGCSRLLSARTTRLCRWCRDQRQHLVSILHGQGPRAWMSILMITMLAWPRITPAVIRHLRHTCATPHLGGTRE